MQASYLFEYLYARTQVEVVGIAEDDPRIGLLLHLLHRDRLDGSRSTHRHKDGGLYISVCGLDDPSACITMGAGMVYGKLHRASWLNLKVEADGQHLVDL